MDIATLSLYAKRPEPYAYGTAVMWTDPYISQNLLKCHLDTENDLASRRPETIAKTVKWILDAKNGKKMRILDLGCGPGLYAEKYAALGHTITGVDFSENSISYAKEEARRKKLAIDYVCQDYLTATFLGEFDLVTLIYMDFCVLRPDERRLLLSKIYSILKPGGFFILDVVNSSNIAEKVLKPSWEISAGNGFWKKEPYIALNMGYHYPEARAFVNQHIIVDESENISTYLFWNFYYENDDMELILDNTGLRIKTVDNSILPSSCAWDGPNASFYILEKS